MLDHNEVKSVSIHPCKKMPLDVRIVVWLLIISGLMGFLFGALLLLGIASSPADYQHRVLFGVLTLTSDSSLTIYTLFVGLAHLVGAYSLTKTRKFAWSFVLVLTTYNISDAYLGFSEHPITTTIGMCFGLGIIAWLIYRRRLYKIGVKPEKLDL